jgi:hypothetical protein
MAQATDLPITSRFHNLSSGALADALGHADAVPKGAEAECKALKDEIKRRGLLEATGDSFAIRVAEQISGRLDVAAVKQYLGDSWQTVRAGALSTQELMSRPTNGRLTALLKHDLEQLKEAMAASPSPIGDRTTFDANRALVAKCAPDGFSESLVRFRADRPPKPASCLSGES